MKSNQKLKTNLSLAIAFAFALVCSVAAAARANTFNTISQFAEIFGITGVSMLAETGGKDNLTLGLNGRIVYVDIDDDGDCEIYTMNRDGWGVIKLTENSETDIMPALSFDGSKIVFMSDRSGSQNLYVMNADGSDQTMVPNTQAVINPAFSPDGSRLVYTCWEDTSYYLQICSINLDGTDKVYLTQLTSSNDEPAYSPDGTKIVFQNYLLGDLELYIMNSDGSNITNLTNDGFGYSSQASFSPDGTKIVFTSLRGGNQNDIYTMNTDGSQQTRLTDYVGPDSLATYSPDGSKIAFISGQTGNNEIWTMDVDGGNQKRTAAGEIVSSPISWQSATAVPPSMTIEDSFVSEPGDGWSPTATFQVRLSFPSQEIVTVDYATAPISATANYDYTDIPPGQVVFTPGQTVKQISVSILADDEDEVIEKFHVNLSNPTGAVIEKGRGVGTIRSDYTRNGKIAFQSNRDLNYEIYEMNADGSNQDNLTDNPSSLDMQAAYSPDGSRIVFVSYRHGNKEIYVMNSDGSDPIRLTDNPAEDIEPSFSPDGSHIIFTSIRDGNSDIYRMYMNGSNETRLTNDPVTDSKPRYSPDGEKIVFSSTRGDGLGSVFMMNSDGSNETQVSQELSYEGDASFSPDGEKILFVSFRNSNRDIYTMNLDGSNVVRLTYTQEIEHSPSYSPDGSLITFHQGDVNNNEVFIMNADGTNPLPLTDSPRYDELAIWQPLPPIHCTYEFDPPTASFDEGINYGYVTVAASDPSCRWTPQHSDDWLWVEAAEHTGSATIGYVLYANQGAARQGVISVGGQTHTVNQAEGLIDLSIPQDMLARRNDPNIFVPIYVHDNIAGSEIISFDLDISYDAGVIQPLGIAVENGGTAVSDFEINYNTGAVGIIRVSGFSTTPPNNNPSFLFLRFRAVGDPGDCSQLNFNSFMFNDGTPLTQTTNGRLCLSTTVAGRVFYGASLTDRPVRGVTVGAMGHNSNFWDTTEVDGNYLLNRFGQGAYTVTPSKEDDINGISALDASIVSRSAVGLEVLSEYRRAAADVSGNGSVNSYDAALIARYVALYPTPGVGVWKFLPATRTYVDLQENLTGEDYAAILMGEVTGNWTSIGGLAAREASNSKPATNAVPVALPSLQAGQNQVITVPVSTGDLTGRGFLAYDLEIGFDPSVLQPIADAPVDKTGTVSSGMSVVANAAQPGRLLVTAYGIDYMQGAGTLMNLRFRVIGQHGQVSPLVFSRMIFNEDPTQSVTQNGQITVLSPTSAQVDAGGRVLTASGAGIRGVVVTMVDSNGNLRTTLTSSFGYYRFENVPAGAAYTFTVSAKRFTFTQSSQTVTIDNSREDINFIANN